MYINSPGTNDPNGRSFSFDTEAFAIADTMQFIRPPIRTICVGQAFGTAAMLLGLGNIFHSTLCIIFSDDILIDKVKKGTDLPYLMQP
jgi:ATP-dependent protease ClpP protease subunit